MLIRDKYKRLCVIENGSFFSMSSNSQMKQSHLTKFQFLKLLSALALPLAVAIFTAITTVQNRQIAYANRQQDLLQAEDDQRQTFFVDYINDISRYRDKHIGNLTNNAHRLLYIRTKTLTILRKLDIERKQYLLLFLVESSLLFEGQFSLLQGANFTGIHLYQYECSFRNLILAGVIFANVSFINCVFENVTFSGVDFRHAILTKSIFYQSRFQFCQVDYADFAHSFISETSFTTTSLAFANFYQAKLDYVQINNVNLSRANCLLDSTYTNHVDIRNSRLPNETLSFLDDFIIAKNLCIAFDEQLQKPIDAIYIENCKWITNDSNVTLVEIMSWSIRKRSVLIDANQAELSISIKQKFIGNPISLEIYFVGVEHASFQRQQFRTSFDCLIPISNFDSRLYIKC